MLSNCIMSVELIIYFYGELGVKYSPSICAIPEVERSSLVSSLVKGTYQASNKLVEDTLIINIDNKILKITSSLLLLRNFSRTISFSFKYFYRSTIKYRDSATARSY